MDRKYYIWGGVLLALVLVLGILFPRPGPSVIEKVIEKTLGAFPGTEFTTDCLVFNGVERCHYRTGLNQASTTVCSIRSPRHSTSTLVKGSVKITTGSTTATSWDFAKSNTLFDATTTPLVNARTLASNAQATFNVASSTVITGAADSDFVFAPGAYFNVKYGGAKGDTNVFVGRCEAEFIVN